ncbi:MAG: N-acetylmuramoyl-L-alanine amidase, partial [Caulobacteraceae bacterium]|nr:N-acetylmuramoyl-L-alanine amidase [Caulobacteraceae bacterium]
MAAVLGGALCLVAAAHAQGAHQGVLNVRFGGDSSTTRVVIEMDRSAHGRELPGAPDERTAVLQLADINADDD